MNKTNKTTINNMDFSTALQKLKEGELVTRLGWSDPNKMFSPFLSMSFGGSIPGEAFDKMNTFSDKSIALLKARFNFGIEHNKLDKNEFDPEKLDVDPINFNRLLLLPEIVMILPNNVAAAWSPSPGDLVAEDWLIYTENEKAPVVEAKPQE